jgi:excisionase family DNA binding protein
MQNTKPDLPVYFTPEEIAVSLRVTAPTVYEWLRSRQLDGVKAGKFWRVSPPALEAFLRIERGRGGRPKKTDAAAAPRPAAAPGAVSVPGGAAVPGLSVPVPPRPSPAKGKAGRRR